MKPTKTQMRLVEEVSREIDGDFYYLKPGWINTLNEAHFVCDAPPEESDMDARLLRQAAQEGSIRQFRLCE